MLHDSLFYLFILFIVFPAECGGGDQGAASCTSPSSSSYSGREGKSGRGGGKRVVFLRSFVSLFLIFVSPSSFIPLSLPHLSLSLILIPSIFPSLSSARPLIHPPSPSMLSPLLHSPSVPHSSSSPLSPPAHTNVFLSETSPLLAIHPDLSLI